MYAENRREWIQLKDQTQKQFNDFSSDCIIWIFATSEKEALEKIEEKGRTIDNIISIGAGGYLFEESLKDFETMLAELHAAKAEFLKDFDNLCGAFLNELWNFEIEISMGETDLDILNDLLSYNNMTLEDLTNEERLELVKVRQHYREEFYKYN